MHRRVLPLLSIACLMTGTLWAADNPFVGQWRVNSSKSKLVDEMKVETAGTNRYKLTLAPDAVDTIVADGTDQPALSGTTLSITVKGPKSWEVVRKMKGRTLLKAEWTLSEDGRTLNDAFTQYLPDGMTLFSQPLPNGSTLFLPYEYERTAGQSGFPGTWDSESAKVRTGIELKTAVYEGDGLSFKRSDEDTAKTIKLDGKDYPDLDTNGKDQGTARSGRRLNERGLEITHKSKGETTSTQQIELSTDLKTLTITERLVNQSAPKSVLVFDRE
ncbi:MAG TPA: hypothetical protein VFV19_13945 [Candidatus Polarisedimenticolaceae bacterium]|nr:hypothetical protein [Candidatus Polarisedimenticolaceae bacterium]